MNCPGVSAPAGEGGDALVDAQVGPYHSRREILAEIAEIEKLPASEARERALE